MDKPLGTSDHGVQTALNRENQMKIIAVTFLLGISVAGSSLAQSETIMAAPAGSFCVSNASDEELFFVTETREGARNYSNLAPSERLCSNTTQAKDGIVSVFQNENALEGCSRIISTGVSENMLIYAEFDRCAWQSNSN